MYVRLPPHKDVKPVVHILWEPPQTMCGRLYDEAASIELAPAGVPLCVDCERCARRFAKTKVEA